MVVLTSITKSILFCTCHRPNITPNFICYKSGWNYTCLSIKSVEFIYLLKIEANLQILIWFWINSAEVRLNHRYLKSGGNTRHELYNTSVIIFDKLTRLNIWKLENSKEIFGLYNRRNQVTKFLTLYFDICSNISYRDKLWLRFRFEIKISDWVDYRRSLMAI